MTDLLLRNVGAILTGSLTEPTIDADSIYVRDGVIAEIGATATDAETVIDVRGTTVAPGLVDAHVHPVAGEYTPRQDTIGWCESYLNGGTTSMVSAGEIHHPGRPTDAEGLKALATLNRKSYDNLRPSGVKLHAGTLILSDDMTVEDIDAVHAAGVTRTKIIFAMDDLDHARRLVDRAKDLGISHSTSTAGRRPSRTRSGGRSSRTRGSISSWSSRATSEPRSRYSERWPSGTNSTGSRSRRTRRPGRAWFPAVCGSKPASSRA
jgi:enamidase